MCTVYHALWVCGVVARPLGGGLGSLFGGCLRAVDQHTLGCDRLITYPFEIKPRPSLAAANEDTTARVGDNEDCVSGVCSQDQIPETQPMVHPSQTQKEAMKRKKSFLSSRHCVKFAVWNVQTLNDPAKGIKLAKEMDRYRIDILGVSDILTY